MSREPKEPSSVSAGKIDKRSKPDRIAKDNTIYTMQREYGGEFVGTAAAICRELGKHPNDQVVRYRLQRGDRNERDLRARQDPKVAGNFNRDRQPNAAKHKSLDTEGSVRIWSRAKPPI